MYSKVSGFALPTVLVAGLLSMMVLLVALTASSGIKASLDDQYYQQLAREAAESGINRAKECLRENDFLSPWAGSTLSPGTTCSGGSPVYDDFLIQTDTMETTFIVADLPAVLDAQTISVTGIVKLKRATNGSVWKTFEYAQKANTSTEVGVTNVAFGYGSNGSGSYGVFFANRTADGAVKTLGLNVYGQLGNNSTSTATTPQDFQLPANVSIRNLYASFLSTGRAIYAVTTNGDLYASGFNTNGMLGLGHNNPVTTPQRASAGIGSEKVAFVDNNSWATYVVTQSGKVYSAGECSLGVLGRDAACPAGSTRNTFGQVPNLPTGPISTAGIAELVTDAQTTYVRTNDGRVYGWGQNTAGSLGASPTPGTGSFTPTAQRIAASTFTNSDGLRAKKMAFDGLTLYVIRDDGSLWATGDNTLSQINGTATNRYTAPVQVNTATGCNTQVRDVATDRSHIAVLFTDVHVCTAGWNGNHSVNRGWLGHGIIATQAPLLRVTGSTSYGLPSSLRVSAIAVNSIFTDQIGRANNTFLVGTDGTVYGAGANHFGQLGNGNNTASTRFVKMQVFGVGEPARTVMSGFGTTVIYTKSNRVYTVGNNEHGQLGNGNTTNQSTPAAYKYTNISAPIFF